MTKLNYKVGSLVTLVNNNGMVYPKYNIGDKAIVLRILSDGLVKVRWFKNNRVDGYWCTSRFKLVIQHTQLVF